MRTRGKLRGYDEAIDDSFVYIGYGREATISEGFTDAQSITIRPCSATLSARVLIL